MKSARLELALDRLSSSDWRRFEKFASEFLVNDFPDLRTTASPSGDGGRDAETFSFSDDVTHMLQYSVTPSWRSKIKDTVTRLNTTHPGVQLLTYATNVEIGAQADDLRQELWRKHKVHLDVRDKNYFVERMNKTRATEAASEQLAVDIVDPLLEEKGVKPRTGAAFTEEEIKATHLFLSLQLRDDTQAKGLTKLSYDALVRAVLVGTDAQNRLSFSIISSRIRALLPNDSPQRVSELTRSALNRLAKRFLRHYAPNDEYCLTHDESNRVKEYLAAQMLEENELNDQIRNLVIKELVEAGHSTDETSAITLRIHRLIKASLDERAEMFSSAVVKQQMSTFAEDQLGQLVLRDLIQSPPKKGTQEANPERLSSVLRNVLASSSSAIQQHLRNLANAYTLLAFLKATPNVQSAMQKVFSHGEIWLDTTAILPLLAEELLSDEKGTFQQILQTAAKAGIRLFVTEGVLEELASHIRRAIAFTRMSSTSWEGGIPFIFQAYVQAGKDPASFVRWTESFMGEKRPLDDLAAYLSERFTITKLDLNDEVSKAPQELGQAVDQIWFEIHDERRERNVRRFHNFATDPMIIVRLAKHDTEHYVGVIQRRKGEAVSPLGFSAWWLTYDRSALRVGELLKTKHGITPPPSPLISIDFLSECLTLGPIRAKVPRDATNHLPVLIDPHLVTFLTTDLLAQANTVRAEMEGLPERVIERRVRDYLDEARRRMGPLSQRGTDAFFDEVALI